jgi:hypothetical protein
LEAEIPMTGVLSVLQLMTKKAVISIPMKINDVVLTALFMTK